MEDEGVTRCWECRNELTNAKCLPCAHTFCCSCLEKQCSGKTYPQRCPRCHQSFALPTRGCGALPDNPLVAPLQRLRDELTATSEAARRLNELNRTLEAHNIEAGSKYCTVRHLRPISASSSVSLGTSMTRLEYAYNDYSIVVLPSAAIFILID